MRGLSYCAAAICGGALAVVAFVVISIWNDVPREEPPQPIAVRPALVKAAVPDPKSVRRPEDNPPAVLSPGRPATEAEVVKGLGGEEVLATLREPDRVTAVLIMPPESGRYFPAHEYRTLGEFVSVPPEVADAIAEIVLDPESYTIFDDGRVTGCFPVYHVHMEYYAGVDRVDLYFCLGCAHLAVYSQGQAVGGMRIYEIKKELAKEFVKIFPSDDSLVELSGTSTPLKTLDQAELEELLGGERFARLLRSATRVTSELLEPAIGELVEPIHATPRTPEIEVPPRTAAHLAELLLDPRQNRQLDATKPCVPRYGWRLRFRTDEESVSIYSCWECATLMIESEGKPVGGVHMDYIAARLLSAARKLHPGDTLLEGVAKAREPLFPSLPNRE